MRTVGGFPAHLSIVRIGHDPAEKARAFEIPSSWRQIDVALTIARGSYVALPTHYDPRPNRRRDPVRRERERERERETTAIVSGKASLGTVAIDMISTRFAERDRFETLPPTHEIPRRAFAVETGCLLAEDLSRCLGLARRDETSRARTETRREGPFVIRWAFATSSTGADRTMIYLTLSMQQFLKACERAKTRPEVFFPPLPKDLNPADLCPSRTFLKTREYTVCPPQAEKALFSLCTKQFAIPGGPGWTLGGLFPAPSDIQDGEVWRLYMKQAREEISFRFLDLLFYPDGSKNKWWNSFAKQKFMNKTLDV